MENIIVAILIITIITAVSLILVSVGNRHKRKTIDRLLLKFSQLGTENNLSFTSQELLYNSIIGLDGLKKKLLFVQDNEGKHNWFIMDLEKVTSCAVKLKNRGLEVALKKANAVEYVEKVVLEFQTENDKLVEVPFYQAHKNDISEKLQLEQKARHWDIILSKMISKNEAKTA